MSEKACMICGGKSELLQTENIVLCRRCAGALHGALRDKLQQPAGKKKKAHKAH